MNTCAQCPRMRAQILSTKSYIEGETTERLNVSCWVYMEPTTNPKMALQIRCFSKNFKENSKNQTTIPLQGIFTHLIKMLCPPVGVEQKCCCLQNLGNERNLIDGSRRSENSACHSFFCVLRFLP